ncbi:hypothetical protein [Streptomyces sp. NPDC051567]|uniref:hypothetical protein n=1 Tax=Streptomyces sp. NPDC051567 TaxID=3365660 RepID=UPI0037ADC575
MPRSYLAYLTHTYSDLGKFDGNDDTWLDTGSPFTTEQLRRYRATFPGTPTGEPDAPDPTLQQLDVLNHWPLRQNAAGPGPDPLRGRP